MKNAEKKIITEVDSSELLSRGGIEIIRSPDDFFRLSERYSVPVPEIRYIDLNRTGIFLPNAEVRVGYRARFITGSDDLRRKKTWFALPVRSERDSAYRVRNGGLYFNDERIAEIGRVDLDTCDVSYQRGPNLINLNSRSRGSCGGCHACVHNYKNLYDGTVLKDQAQLITKDQIETFFKDKEKNGLDISELQQIAVVTGLFGSEADVVEHMEKIDAVVQPKGFNGELMYFGCEVNSDEALRRLSRLGKFSLIYAIDNFTKRSKILAERKSVITIEGAKDTLNRAKKQGIETTFAYIIGIDDLDSMKNGFEFLMDSITRFPVINIYQIQTEGQLKIMDKAARSLEFYVKGRIILEKLFRDKEMLPRRWENYRPLWYDFFDGRPLPANTFGD